MSEALPTSGRCFIEGPCCSEDATPCLPQLACTGARQFNALSAVSLSHAPAGLCSAACRCGLACMRPTLCRDWCSLRRAQDSCRASTRCVARVLRACLRRVAAMALCTGCIAACSCTGGRRIRLGSGALPSLYLLAGACADEGQPLGVAPLEWLGSQCSQGLRRRRAASAAPAESASRSCACGWRLQLVGQ